MKQVADVAIVGGGPAGANCALELARQGIHPIVFDHSHPREKPCGGGISPHLIERFPLVERFRANGFTFGDFMIISCTNVQVLTKELQGGFSISRKCFDEGILNMAVAEGAYLIREKVTGIQKEGKRWSVITQKRLVSAKIIVGADGVNSLVRRATVGPISKENLALTLGYLAECSEKQRSIIKFLAEIPGYIWVFPGKTSMNVGIGSEIRYGGMLKNLLDVFVNSFFSKIKTTSKYAALLPMAKKPEFFNLPCAGHNWLLVGDAAGHVDPVSGGGILYALWGSKLAAQSIVMDETKAYESMWRKEFGNNLQQRCKIRDSFYDPLRSTISIFRGLMNKTFSWAQ